MIYFRDDASAKVPPLDAPQPVGLLVDLRNLSCVDILQWIMGSSKIAKLRCGVKCDCESVMCQIVPIPLQVEPVRIVDIQLAFSAPRRRQSMKHMLERVPRNLPANMPENEQIDWDDFHSRNCRALEFLLSNRVAACAMDDVFWIEVILRSQSVPSEYYYASACIATEYVLTQMMTDPHGVKALKMRFQWIDKYSGVRRAELWTSLLLHSSSPRCRAS